MKNFLKTLLLAVATFHLVPHKAFAQRVDTWTESSAFDFTLRLCQPPRGDSVTSRIPDTLTTVDHLADVFLSGVKSFTGNPFLPSAKTFYLFRNPGYERAMDTCFGSSVLDRNAFKFTMIALDRLGYVSDWILLAGTIRIASRLFSATKLALAHQVAFRRVGQVIFGAATVAFVLQIKSSYERIKDRKRIAAEEKKMITDIDLFKSGADEIGDLVTELTRERILEIDEELRTGNLSPERIELRKAQRAKLDSILQHRIRGAEKPQVAPSDSVSFDSAAA